ncbi:hypothetical protein [Synechococcus sp. UW140]|uniref:hypothetical protein n=1 Tax=Synechococcus sp. UW140 TaxID=368503 RepID=UPI0025EA5706|nr:hypothetical protein [Synechococcus sp. UW140]
MHRNCVDLPYGEEEISLPEDELHPNSEAVIDRVGEFDLKIHNEQEREWPNEYIVNPVYAQGTPCSAKGRLWYGMHRFEPPALSRRDPMAVIGF